ncbi:MAG: sigma-54 dependent transcriptional regulator [Pseudomonadales bacterium]|nr:sigma-54 dependent transcriptional regulator [Pseudomonadales bacterium]
MNQSVLIVDDEPDIRELLEITLGRMNVQSHSAPDLSSAQALLAAQSFNLCLTDMRLPDGNGIDLVRHIQDAYPQLPVAVITAYGSTETAVSALKAGAFDFVSKPVDLGKLRSLVQTALKLSTETEDKDPNPEKFSNRIIGESPQIEALRDQISKLARSQAPVFISGESGSGKELVARAIHFEGPRRDKEFIAINCGALSSELMESEFFGHKKGSFTGADQDKTGLFQAAHGGSLFLDEIADLPLHMQVKLLRAIQEKSIRPVGSQTEIPVDVRIISATHKNLNREIEQGNLRHDLYYRINVIQLKVPSLRERRSDIPLLARHILHNLSQPQGLQTVSITDQAIAQLQAYDFPGNVRELENLLQRAFALADHDCIEALDLPTADPPAEQPTPPDESLAHAATENFSLEKHLEHIEKSMIEATLRETRWNKTAAAKKLGMTFRAFRYRTKKLGLD